MKTARVRLQHRAFGWCVITRSRHTEAGAEVFDAQFDDRKHRIVPAAPEFWVSNQSEVEQAFAELLETKPEVRIPQGLTQGRDRSLPTPMYEVTDDIPHPHEVTDGDAASETDLGE